MASEDPNRKVKDRLIEENLKRAFSDKASEEVPSELLSLLEQLRSQDEHHGD